MTKKYLSMANMPPKSPIMPMFWTAAGLKVFEAPEWLWGVFGVIFLILVIAAIVQVVTYEKVEL